MSQYFDTGKSTIKYSSFVQIHKRSLFIFPTTKLLNVPDLAIFITPHLIVKAYFICGFIYLKPTA